MKKNVLTLGLLIIGTSTSFAQDNVIRYAEGKITAPNNEIPYGQIVLLQGESQADYESITVECIVVTETKVYQTERGDGNKWSAKIGPFPIRSEVIITIKENRKLTQVEQTNIKNLIAGYIADLKLLGSFDVEQLKGGLHTRLDNLPYKDKSGRPIDSLFSWTKSTSNS